MNPRFILIVLNLSFTFCFGQEGPTELVRDKTLAYLIKQDENKQIPKSLMFIYFEKSENRITYYVDHVWRREQLSSHPPSYYLLDTTNRPVLIYSGIENKIAYSKEYKERTIQLCDGYLYPEGVSYMVHTCAYMYEFEDERLVRKRELCSKKNQEHLPDWIQYPKLEK